MAIDVPGTKERKNQSRSPVPAYLRIEEDIRLMVADGRLAVGSRLASRHNLAKEYGVALSTAQQAISNLIADGLLESYDRLGTFVVSKNPVDRLSAAEVAVEQPVAREMSTPAVTRSTGKTLGIVTTIRIEPVHMPDIGSYWARQAVSTLERFFSAAGGTTRFFNRHPYNPATYEGRLLHGDTIPMTDALHSLRAAGADALVIVGLHDDCDLSDEIISSVDIDNVPVVYIAWHEMRPPLTQIFYDNQFAGYQAAKHLLQAGYRRLTFLSPFHANWLTEREVGVREAVRHGGYAAGTVEVVHPSAIPAAYDRTRADATSHATMLPIFKDFAARVDRDSEPTPGPSLKGRESDWGIIAPNDHTAYAVMQAAEEEGLKAGVDFGLIGFDDDSRSSALGLSSVRPPIDHMAEEAGRLVLRALKGEPVGSQTRLRSDVIARSSTARLST